MYAQSHVAQKQNPKIARLIDEHGIAAFGAWHDLLISAKLQIPSGRFIDRESLEAALWPESVPYIPALIDCGLLAIRKNGVHIPSGWNKWQASEAHRRKQAERTEKQRSAAKKRWAKEKKQQRTCRVCGGYIKDGTPKVKLAPTHYVHADCANSPVPDSPRPMRTSESGQGPVVSAPNRAIRSSADTLTLSPQSSAFALEATASDARENASNEGMDRTPYACPRQGCRFVGLLQDFPDHDEEAHRPRPVPDLDDLPF